MNIEMTVSVYKIELIYVFFDQVLNSSLSMGLLKTSLHMPTFKMIFGHKRSLKFGIKKSWYGGRGGDH